MSTNKNSIHILRGTKPGVNSTTLYDGQLYFDRGTKTLQVGDKSNSTIGNNNNYVTVKDGAINDAKVASNAAIKGSKLADANNTSRPSGITTSKIENSAITGLKIANGSISDSKVATDADINGTKFKDNSISGSKLHDANGSSGITTGKIENNAITTPKILDNAITPEKLDSTKEYAVKTLTVHATDSLDKQFAKYTNTGIEYAGINDSFNTLVYPTELPDTTGTVATKEQIENGDITAKNATYAYVDGYTQSQIEAQGTIDERLKRLGFKSGNFVMPNGTITENTITRQGNYVIGKLIFSEASILGEQHKIKEHLEPTKYYWTLEIPVSSKNFYSSTEKPLTAENLIWESNFTSEGGEYTRYISGTPKIANNKLIITSKTVEDTYLGSTVTYGNCYLKSMTLIFGYEADPLQ